MNRHNLILNEDNQVKEYNMYIYTVDENARYVQTVAIGGSVGNHALVLFTGI